MQHATIEVAGLTLPCHQVSTLLVGSGAAALNCAVHLGGLLAARGAPPGEHIALVTAALGGGASFRAGSDKQTYYRPGLIGDTAVSPLAMAQALTAGGCCHGDLALVEAECSLREFHHLVELGVPFPHNAYGAFVGYRTDHDPFQCATSAGPWTSRLMCQALLGEVRRLGVPIFNGHQVVALLVAAGERRVCGVLAVDLRRAASADRGLVVFAAAQVVMATGGPGGLYAESAYPHSQAGSPGLLFAAGAAAQNLAESQFGLASLRPRWNLSGTYQQVVPRYLSTDPQGGDPREFLQEYFPSPRELGTAIFLKGYQWPFDAARTAGSSLIDLAVDHERRQRGRRVWLDYTANPAGLDPFSPSLLDEEARYYLERSGATQGTPYQRLLAANPESAALYAGRGVDLSRAPLEVAVCAQHNNGGFAVNTWWESSLPGLFIIGELAATHGVKRPGGAALNAGQVGGLRAAQRLAHHYDPLAPASLPTAAREQLARVIGSLPRGGHGPTPAAVVRQVRETMSGAAAFLRSAPAVSQAAGQMAELWQAVGEGLRGDAPGQWLRALAAQDLVLAARGYLAALQAYLDRGGGSRGSYLVLEEAGTPLHPALPLRARAEQPEHRQEVIEVTWEGENFWCRVVPVRPLPRPQDWFETIWQAFSRGEVFR